jgi:hypothetical protein
MLIADEVFEPIVSTLSKPGLFASTCAGSIPLLTPGFLANGLRIGMVEDCYNVKL